MPPRIIEQGFGRPIVLIPGIQGRCEWGLPTFRALAELGHAVTYSLADEPTSGFPWNETAGFDNYVTQLDGVIRATCAVPPILVGISYGGLIAAEYLARHPGSAAGLVLASAPPPGWTLPARAQRYLRAPRLTAPLFWLGAPLRVYPELKAALPRTGDRWRFVWSHGPTVAAAPPSSARMVRRLRWLTTTRFALDHRLDVPALLVTGEADLERVVPPDATLAYRTWLPEAPAVTLPHTGHGGTVTRPDLFAAHVGRFLMQLAPARPQAPASRAFQQEPVRAHGVS